MNNEYDIRSIFEEMELELIRSMKRNLAKHQKWEEGEGFNWTMWQAEQLKSFDKFKNENEKIFGKRFATVNAEIRKFLEQTYETSGLDQEKEILEILSKGKQFVDKTEKGLEGSFFNLNKKKMEALVNATTSDLTKAEHAMLRLTNDQYRKIIFKAETMFNSGGFTLKQAIDAASKDFLKAGINCVEYKDGRRVNIASYAEMCLRTSNKRAKFVAEGDVRKEYGIHTVKISKYGGCSKTCLPWQGRVYVDDVWSGGTKEEAEDKKLPLLSTAIEGGLFHPNCKHTMFTYYYDRKKAYGQLEQGGVEVPQEEQEHRRNHLHIQQQKRLEEGSLDPQNIQEAIQKKEQWIKKDLLIENTEENKQKKMNYADVLLEYLVKKDKSTLSFDANYIKSSHKSEVETAMWLFEKFGGDIRVLNESKQFNVKTADFLWNGKLWDLKDITSAKAADSAIRKGLKQIESSPGGIILNLTTDDIDVDELLKHAGNRIKRSSKSGIDILIKQDDKIIKFIRYKK